MNTSITMYTESNLLMETNSNDNSAKKEDEFQPLFTNIQRDCTLHSYACRQGETAGV